MRKERSDLHYIGPEGPDYYKDVATSIEYSTTQQERPEVVTASVEPHTIAERQKDQVWDLTLGQALQLRWPTTRSFAWQASSRRRATD